MRRRTIGLRRTPRAARLSPIAFRRLGEWKRRNQELGGACRHEKEKERLAGSRRIGGTQYGRFGLHQKLRRKAQEGAGRTESKGESVGVQRPVVHYRR